MNIENLDAGQDFEELPDTYTIFVTENDVFGHGNPVYRVDRMHLNMGVDIMCRAFEETRLEKAMQIAKNLIEQGQLTLEVIASVTELPLEEIQKLAAEMTEKE